MERQKNEKVLADFWSLIDQMTVKVIEKNTENLQDDNTNTKDSESKGEKVSIEQLEAAMGPGESFVDKEDENPELEDFLDQIIANRVEPETSEE